MQLAVEGKHYKAQCTCLRSYVDGEEATVHIGGAADSADMTTVFSVHCYDLMTCGDCDYCTHVSEERAYAMTQAVNLNELPHHQRCARVHSA